MEGRQIVHTAKGKPISSKTVERLYKAFDQECPTNGTKSRPAHVRHILLHSPFHQRLNKAQDTTPIGVFRINKAERDFAGLESEDNPDKEHLRKEIDRWDV